MGTSERRRKKINDDEGWQSLSVRSVRSSLHMMLSWGVRDNGADKRATSEWLDGYVIKFATHHRFIFRIQNVKATSSNRSSIATRLDWLHVIDNVPIDFHARYSRLVHSTVRRQSERLLFKRERFFKRENSELEVCLGNLREDEKLLLGKLLKFGWKILSLTFTPASQIHARHKFV